MVQAVAGSSPVAHPGFPGRIVHTCGFDSIPSDIGVLSLHEAAKEGGHGELEETSLVVKRMRAAPSGGTIDTMRTAVDTVKKDPKSHRAFAGFATSGVRQLLDRLIPEPGEGPSEKARERGFFEIDIHTKTSSGKRLRCEIRAQGDPGYKATAVMLGESSLCLARDDLPDAAGVLTPATAMGRLLADRLRAAGHTYVVVEDDTS